jgi:hypothetical protein
MALMYQRPRRPGAPRSSCTVAPETPSAGDPGTGIADNAVDVVAAQPGVLDRP